MKLAVAFFALGLLVSIIQALPILDGGAGGTTLSTRNNDGGHATQVLSTNHEGLLYRREPGFGVSPIPTMDFRLLDMVANPIDSLKSGAKNYMPDLNSLKQYVPNLKPQEYLSSVNPLAQLKTWWKGHPKAVEAGEAVHPTPVKAGEPLEPEPVKPTEPKPELSPKEKKYKDFKDGVTLHEQKSKAASHLKVGPPPTPVAMKTNTAPRLSLSEKAAKERQIAEQRKALRQKQRQAEAGPTPEQIKHDNFKKDMKELEAKGRAAPQSRLGPAPVYVPIKSNTGPRLPTPVKSVLERQNAQEMARFKQQQRQTHRPKLTTQQAEQLKDLMSGLALDGHAVSGRKAAAAV